ncbi:sterol 26-hydroxylase, mitochondrial-like [Sinocyclocheilus grahami]|uniref:sterol 26-hydroxylase, mitochondrial-like n=1 Tax=Sinocyclocheilus grahami TaxID=75366 RepID=UPI0007AC9699|nr:PREDICTED: sterol 26-hydroxylase, mitochondrial-like [Sinocyclocheilus grahami]
MLSSSFRCPVRQTPVIMLSSLVKADRLASHVGKKYAPFYEFIARTLKSQPGDVDLHSATSISGNYKTIDDLPGPSLATTAYWLFVKGYADKSHAMQVEHKRLYGPIWRSRFGPFDVVNVATAELIAQVIRQEGRYPVRTDLPHWKEYRDMRGQAYGIHVDTGPEWYRIRSALNPKMLKLKEVAAYAPIIHEVVSDLLQRVELLRLRSPDQVTVKDLASELYKFGFEGISSILFETRLGCLQEEIPTDTLRFISAVNDMLALSEMVLFFPRWTRHIFPFWKRFVQAWDDLYDTSNTLSWTLYHLARDAEVQNRLYNEIASVCPNKELPTAEHLTRMPYMKAVIKETLRIYPVVPGNGRLTVDSEVIVDNYWFPKKTQFHLCHYAVSHDESNFPEPECFVPDRWLRDNPSRSQHHPYSSVPFGVGVRACVGKRVAELEMYFALSRLMQHYEVRTEEGAPSIHPKTRTLLIPSKPIDLQFIPRA